jgi:signal peptidase I
MNDSECSSNPDMRPQDPPERPPAAVPEAGESGAEPATFAAAAPERGGNPRPGEEEREDPRPRGDEWGGNPQRAVEVDAVPGPWARIGREIAAGFQTLVSAAVYATLIVTFGFQVARVDGLSMAPTLEDHDRLIVNKLVYELGDPRPGDIVMLYYPLNPDKMFVKRVIAREGDTVRIVDGRVYVNEQPLRDDYVPNEFRSHDDWGPHVIQQGYYFVMGDHRNNSSDSRHWGQVPKKYIVGKVKVRWWPLQDARIF